MPEDKATESIEVMLRAWYLARLRERLSIETNLTPSTRISVDKANVERLVLQSAQQVTIAARVGAHKTNSDTRAVCAIAALAGINISILVVASMTKNPLSASSYDPLRACWQALALSLILGSAIYFLKELTKGK